MSCTLPVAHFEIGSMEWFDVSLKGNKAPARYEHSAGLVQRKGEAPQLLVMFGAGDEGLRNDLWAFDLGLYTDGWLYLLMVKEFILHRDFSLDRTESTRKNAFAKNNAFVWPHQSH